MDQPRRAIAITWSVAALLLAGLAALAAGPLAVGWRCYRLHAEGEHVRAELVAKLESPGLVLRMTEGSAAGQVCTADTSAGHHASLAVGDALGVVHRPGIPGECELEATLVNSLLLLASVSGVVGFAALLILGVAGFVHRSFRRPAWPSTRLELAAGAPACPCCGEPMAEGCLVLLAGLHWRRIGQPVGLPHALRGLPGTVGWRGRPLLHAFRCERCAVVTFRHGDASAPRLAQPVAEARTATS